MIRGYAAIALAGLVTGATIRAQSRVTVTAAPVGCSAGPDFR